MPSKRLKDFTLVAHPTLTSVHFAYVDRGGATTESERVTVGDLVRSGSTQTPSTNNVPRSSASTGKLDVGWLPDASTTAKGVVELATSVETTAGLAVQANDPRLSDDRNPLTHGHAAGDITSGTLATARLGSGTANSTAVLRGDQTWGSPPSHSHDAGDINSGTMATARLGSGSATSTKVLLGNSTWGDVPTHGHAGADITSGYVPLARLGAGTPTAATVLLGDQSWGTTPPEEVTARARVREHFMGGLKDWNVSSLVAEASPVGHPGVVSLSAPASGMQYTQFGYDDFARGCIAAADVSRFLWVAKLPSLSTVEFRLGLLNEGGVSGTDGFFFRWSSTDTTMRYCVWLSASEESDTGTFTMTTGWHEFEVRIVGGAQAEFLVDGVAQASFTDDYFPTGVQDLVPYAEVTSLHGSEFRTLWLDAFQLDSVAL